jgi:hypothetical protein
MTRRPAALLILVLSLALGRLSHAAEERELARVHFDRAVAHLEKNELLPALREFEKAQSIHPHFAVLYNIGKVQIALGEPLRALESLERYLELGGENLDGARRAEVDRLIAEQSMKLGRVNLEVNPPGAMIAVDGREVGKSPLARPLRLLPGRYELSITLAAYRPEKRNLDVRAGLEQSVVTELARLEPPPKLGSIAVDCTLAEVTIKLDGRAHARTPARSIVAPVGAREILFERTGYAASRQLVLVEEEGSASAQCKLKPLTPLPIDRSGRIEVIAPAPHRVTIDGSPVPEGGRLPQGRHRVEVVASGYRRWTRDVTVEPGKTLRLEPELEPDDETLRSRQSQRTLAYAVGITGLVALTGAGVMYVWNSTRHEDWKDEQKRLDARWDSGKTNVDLERDQILNDELLESIQLFDRFTAGLAIAGGAAVIGGGVLLVTGEDPAAKSRPVLAIGPRSSLAGWSFAW